MHKLTLFLILFISLLSQCKDQPKPLYIIEHSLDSGKSWSVRGSIASVGLNKRLVFIPAESNKFWSPETINLLLQKSQQDENAYQIRLRKDNITTMATISAV